MRVHASAIALALLAFACANSPSRAATVGNPTRALRVCADPDNLPFSNRAREGFENRLAAWLAQDLGRPLRYVWVAEHAHFLHHTLGAGLCDALIGVPTGLEDVQTTRPYYASTYVFVWRRASGLSLSSLRDPRLHRLRIGVHLLDGEQSPPEIALTRLGIVDNLVGFMIYPDGRTPEPESLLLRAVQSGRIDVATAWGPLAGYFALRSGGALAIAPIRDTESFKPLQFQFAISAATRRGDERLVRALDTALMRERPRILALLRSYGVPLVPLPGDLHD